MRLTCPSCMAEFSLDVALGRDEDARAVADLLQRHLPIGHALVRYVGLFRPAKRRLQMARMVGLLQELLPDIERGAITRKGRDWAAPPALWQAAIDQVLANRDKGTLSLPLAGHGYLYEVLAGLADKAEGAAERGQLEAARARGAAGGAPVALAQAMAVVDVRADGSFAAAPAQPLPYDPTKGPSRSARQTKAAMEAAMKARQGLPADEDEGKQP